MTMTPESIEGTIMDWDHIGKLAAVAVIRTGLNFFLSMEMKAEMAVEKEKRSSCLNPMKKIR